MQKIAIGMAVMPCVFMETLVAFVLEKTKYDGKRIKLLIGLLLAEFALLIILW